MVHHLVSAAKIAHVCSVITALLIIYAGIVYDDLMYVQLAPVLSVAGLASYGAACWSIYDHVVHYHFSDQYELYYLNHFIVI